MRLRARTSRSVEILAFGLGLVVLLGSTPPHLDLEACDESCPCDTEEPAEQAGHDDEHSLDASSDHDAGHGDDDCTDGCSDCACRRITASVTAVAPARIAAERAPSTEVPSALGVSFREPAGSTQGVFRPPRTLLG